MRISVTELTSIVAQLQQLNEAQRFSNQLRQEQIRQDRSRSCECRTETVQQLPIRLGTFEHQNKDQAQERRPYRSYYVPEGRQERIQLQKSTPSLKKKMEEAAPDLHRATVEGSRFPQIPLQRKYELERTSG